MQTLNRHYTAFEQKRLARPNRQRAIGAGGKFKLSLEERVFMTLFALRLYPTGALLGFLFDLDESNAFRNVQITKAFLAEHLLLPKQVRKQRIAGVDREHGATDSASERQRAAEAFLFGEEEALHGEDPRGARGAHGMAAGWGWGLCGQSARQAHVRGVWGSGKVAEACSGLGGQGVCWVRGLGA